MFESGNPVALLDSLDHPLATVFEDFSALLTELGENGSAATFARRAFEIRKTSKVTVLD